MREVPLGWRTDLAVLRHTGSVVEDRGDHLLVTTPANPGYHWGNFVFVTDEDAVDDAPRWVRTFRTALPDATWVAIGLVRMPGNRSAWTAQGLDLELDDVLSTGILPTQTPLADGYTVRRLSGDDWAVSVARAVAAQERTDGPDPSYASFVRRRTSALRALSERDVAAYFGAFRDGRLVADLGIVRCGATARYQSVGTDEEHRRRGLASHLLGVAARWSAEHGCDRWVILTEATNPAGRVYRSLGFRLDSGNAQAYRTHGSLTWCP